MKPNQNAILIALCAVAILFYAGAIIANKLGNAPPMWPESTTAAVAATSGRPFRSYSACIEGQAFAVVVLRIDAAPSIAIAPIWEGHSRSHTGIHQKECKNGEGLTD